MSKRDPADSSAPFPVLESRLATNRTRELRQPERNLYRWILREMAEGRRVNSEHLQASAGRNGLQPDLAQERLEELDLVHWDAQGTVRCAYPFSGVATDHVLYLSGVETPVYAMCAVDALGIPYMIGKAATISSKDPLTDAVITVHVDPDVDARWLPGGAVVVVAAKRDPGPFETLCCPMINFFDSSSAG